MSVRDSSKSSARIAIRRRFYVRTWIHFHAHNLWLSSHHITSHHTTSPHPIIRSSRISTTHVDPTFNQHKNNQSSNTDNARRKSYRPGGLGKVLMQSHKFVGREIALSARFSVRAANRSALSFRRTIRRSFRASSRLRLCSAFAALFSVQHTTSIHTTSSESATRERSVSTQHNNARTGCSFGD